MTKYKANKILNNIYLGLIYKDKNYTIDYVEGVDKYYRFFGKTGKVIHYNKSKAIKFLLLLSDLGEL